MNVDRIAIDFLGEYKSVVYISGFKAWNCIGSELVKVRDCIITKLIICRRNLPSIIPHMHAHTADLSNLRITSLASLL